MTDGWKPRDGAGYIPTEEGGTGREDTGGDYQDEWEDLDEKVLLVQLLAEQQRTNQLLAELVGDDTATDTGDDTTEYRCTRCGRVVAESDRERHTTSQHKAPPGQHESLFDPVE